MLNEKEQELVRKISINEMKQYMDFINTFANSMLTGYIPYKLSHGDDSTDDHLRIAWAFRLAKECADESVKIGQDFYDRALKANTQMIEMQKQNMNKVKEQAKEKKEEKNKTEKESKTNAIV